MTIDTLHILVMIAAFLAAKVTATIFLAVTSQRGVEYALQWWFGDYRGFVVTWAVDALLTAAWFALFVALI